SEAIVFALTLVGDPGDEVIVPEPFYTNYAGFAVQAGLVVVPVTCRLTEGFRLPAAMEIESRITNRTRALLVCSPCNPTGHVLTATEWDELRDLAIRHDLFLLSDEVYREFVYDGAKPTSVLAIRGLGDRAVMLDSISKRYSVCGARVGCLVTRNREVLDGALRLGQARLCPPTMEQMAAMKAIHASPSYLEGVVDEYRRRRDAIFEELESIPGTRALKPEGAFYAMVRLPVDDADHFCRWLLSDFSMEGETVMLAPGGGFYATPGLGRDEVRIAYVLNVPTLRKSMGLLRRALEVYPRRETTA
ncbi:MAG: pyridoxal phosphate-dependent aminotransferase, partial [Planctomycetes bacterium]|nr:pyridoxal phosphate-dependent aminotransferase [Planctomycetota bacterium]